MASPVLTVTDDPFIPSGPGSRLFDEEGLAATVRPVIDKRCSEKLLYRRLLWQEAWDETNLRKFIKCDFQYRNQRSG